MKVSRYILICCIAFITCHVKAQAILGVTIDSFPTNGIIGDTTAHSGIISVHNYGSQAISDSMYLEYEIGGVTNISTNPNAGIFFWDTINIAAQDSETKRVVIHFTPAIFRIIGTSGVVIWPVCPYQAQFITDTTSWLPVLTYPLNIAQTTGENLLVYMDGPQLFIKTDAGNLLKRVRICAITGQFIEEQDVLSSTVIDMDRYASGMYIVQITFTDDSQKACKIINMANH